MFARLSVGKIRAVLVDIPRAGIKILAPVKYLLRASCSPNVSLQSIWAWFSLGLGMVWTWFWLSLGLVWAWFLPGVSLVWAWSGLGLSLVWA